MQTSMQPSLAAIPMQTTHTKESTERMLLVAYAQKASIPSPMTKAYAIAASYPYAVNTPAVLDAIIKRLERSSLKKNKLPYARTGGPPINQLNN